MSNLHTAFRQAFKTAGTRVLIQSERGSYTGAQIAAAVAAHAGALTLSGVSPGDRVAVQTEKSVDVVFLYLACLQMGAVYLPLNTAYQAGELAYFLDDAQPRLFIVDPSRQTVLAQLAAGHGGAQVAALGRDGSGDWLERVERAAPCQSVVDRAADDLAVICYTSGTTGRSKGAMITHGNLASNAAALVDIWGFSERDVLLHALPLYHIHGLFVALHCAFLSGARLLLLDRFAPGEVLRRLPEATVMMGVPTFYTRLLAEPGFGRESCRSMRLFISGSAPLLSDTFHTFFERTGHFILERYGMTETGMTSSNPLHGERRAGSVGHPLPGVSVRITSTGGGAADPAAIGPIEVRGPNVFKGYWRLPEKTAAEFTADGYFMTGDLGHLDGNGYLHIVGRAKDLVISGGLNVYPKEVEEIIDAIAGVVESAVFGLPHPDLGEAVSAAVVCSPGVNLQEAQILQALRGKLAAFKLPKRIFLVPELPRNAMAKVQKAALRERYRASFVE
jgi:malonyl-CoA/methylmalonyl-CoA synthetase